MAMAVAAALLANNWLEQQKLASTKEVVTIRTKPVVVAAVNVPFGTTLEERHVKIISVAEDAFGENTFPATKDVTGKIAKQALYAGETIRRERLADRGDKGGSPMAAMVAPSMRAVTVRVNDVIGVAGFLLPGDYVDILASRQEGASRGEINIRTVLEKIKVLAVDQIASPEKDAPVIVRAVTLEVDPRQAELLMEATQEGSVQLALRNPLDDAAVAPPQPPPAPVKPPEEPQKTVEAPPPPPPPPPQIIYRERPATRLTVIRGDGKGLSAETATTGK